MTRAQLYQIVATTLTAMHSRGPEIHQRARRWGCWVALVLAAVPWSLVALVVYAIVQGWR